MAVTFDTSILLSYMQAKAGLTGGLSMSFGGSGSATTQKSPTAPWSTASTAPKLSELVKAALSGRKLINEGAAQLDVAGASKDYQKLFALYQGLNTLYGLAERANSDTLGAFDRNQVSKAFARGLEEVLGYTGGLKLDNLRVTQGQALDMTRSQLNSTTSFGKADTDVGVPLADIVYDTAVVYTGKSSDEVPAFAGPVQFQIMVKQTNTTKLVNINLDDMGATPRTMSNVANYINGQLSAAGAYSRFSVTKTPGEPQTITVNGAKVTLGTPPDKMSFKVTGDIAEKISFIAPVSAGAVYLSQTAGRADDPATKDVNEESRVQQFLKFQDDANGDVPDPVAQQGETFRVDGRVFAKAMDADVKAVRQTVTGPDGSVYMLADITGTVAGQTIKGKQDVALLKYDSAGNLIFARTLGAADTASGLALAVSADGQIAVAGSTTGVFENGDFGVDATKSDSFVTLYDKNGDELWTQRRAAREDDEATSVAFGPDGAVLVAGRAKSNMPGAAAIGGWDGYVQSFTGVKQPLGGYKVTTNFTTQFGTAGADTVSGMAVDGTNMATVGIEDGRAVVRRYDLSNPGAPVLVAIRDLGELQGGSIAGIAFNGGDIVVAGTAKSGGLTGASVNGAFAGASDAFVATVSSTFGGGSGADNLTYFGGQGADTATAMTVSGGKVWITGSATKDLPDGSVAIGKVDGYLARLDPATGAVEYSKRFTAVDGQAAPTSIAVDPNGSSALDLFGLPKGPMEYTQSELLTSATSLRAGDQFQIRADEGGRAGTVTIDANETLQTLAAKIQRAAGFRVKVQIVKDGAYQRLQIKPLNDRSTIEILPGKADADALKALGLPAGVVRVRPDDLKKVDKDKVYGLTLGLDLKLDTKEGAKAALEQLNLALTAIRSAYRDLNAMFNPSSVMSAAKPVGTAPAYLTAQAANYQAALDRLLGGG